MTGKVKTLTEKGFGFINTGEKKDMFFHLRNLRNCEFNDLKVGDKLEYDVEEGPKGTFATNVDLISNED